MQAYLRIIFMQKPGLKAFCNALNEAHIRWALFAGTATALLTSNRVPTDIDIIVHDNDFEMLAQLLKEATRTDNATFPITTSDGEALSMIASTLWLEVDGTEIDIMSRAKFVSDEGEFVTSLSDVAVAHRIELRERETSVWLAEPFDTILFKAFMRRGAEQNKFDVSDIEAIVKRIPMDRDYIEKRVNETGLSSRAQSLLKKLNIV